MKTPVCDFVKEYKRSGASRLHMPGHKGNILLGFEDMDITEITGADSLYEADGIIRESEMNASRLFGSTTFYSTEGSSHCIRAMIYLVSLDAAENGEKVRILAARNCHKTFVSACALLDIDVAWMDARGGYLSAYLTAEKIEEAILAQDKKPHAVYLTSPDYLGAVADIRAISEVCRKHGVLLCVDNAHGAYLKFLQESEHPIDLGADICCDSAHKTLPCLTGGAYLHISDNAEKGFAENAKEALALFGSTSPSYLILQSLDKVNEYIENGYREKLEALCEKLSALKIRLCAAGYSFFGDEKIKFTVECKKYGYYGYEIAEILREKGIVCEFFDRDYLVLMFTPELSDRELEGLESALLSIEKRAEIDEEPPVVAISERKMSIREATMSPCEILPVRECEGRVLARLGVSCPPAVPIGICGETVTREMIEAFLYYGSETVAVIKK